MTFVEIECLQCGAPRRALESSERTVAGSCPSCDYVGWAPWGTLTPDERRELREQLRGDEHHTFSSAA